MSLTKEKIKPTISLIIGIILTGILINIITQTSMTLAGIAFSISIANILLIAFYIGITQFK